MILVNNPGSWAHIYAPLEHAPWHGLTPTDLVFPFFLFAVGSALAFIMPRLEAGGDAVFWKKILKRTVFFFLIGLFLNCCLFVIVLNRVIEVTIEFKKVSNFKVFPFFLFVVRNALAFIMPKLEAGGDAVFWKKILIRSVLIFLIGLFLNWWPFVTEVNRVIEGTTEFQKVTIFKGFTWIDYTKNKA